MDRKYYGKIITGLLVVALLAVIYFASTAPKNPHPPEETWLTQHKTVVETNKSPERCFKCHKEGFDYCNSCHKEKGKKIIG